MNDAVPAIDALSAAASAIYRATTIACFNPRSRGANTNARRHAYPGSADTDARSTDTNTGPDTYTGGANTGGRSRSRGWSHNTTFRYAGAGAIDSRARWRRGKCEAQCEE